MGAIGWENWGVWEEDVGAALSKVQEEVFKEGKYGHVGQWRKIPGPWRARREGISVGQWASLQGLFGMMAVMEVARGRRGGRTIEGAVERAGMDGTHSILDIRTVRVGRGRVEEKAHELLSGLKRWSACILRCGRRGRMGRRGRGCRGGGVL